MITYSMLLPGVLQARFEEAEKMFRMVATGAEGVRKAIASLQYVISRGHFRSVLMSSRCLEQAEAVISDAKAAVDTLHSAECESDIVFKLPWLITL